MSPRRPVSTPAKARRDACRGVFLASCLLFGSLSVGLSSVAPTSKAAVVFLHGPACNPFADDPRATEFITSGDTFAIARIDVAEGRNLTGTFGASSPGNFFRPEAADRAMAMGYVLNEDGDVLARVGAALSSTGYALLAPSVRVFPETPFVDPACGGVGIGFDIPLPPGQYRLLVTGASDTARSAQGFLLDGEWALADARLGTTQFLDESEYGCELNFRYATPQASRTLLIGCHTSYSAVDGIAVLFRGDGVSVGDVTWDSEGQEDPRVPEGFFEAARFSGDARLQITHYDEEARSTPQEPAHTWGVFGILSDIGDAA